MKSNNKNKINTSGLGRKLVIDKIGSLGGTNIKEIKDGLKIYINFKSKDGKNYKVTTRSKKSGTWQTSTNYGVPCSKNDYLNEVWVFVDIDQSPKFYPIPEWWIRNNIFEIHQSYLDDHGGHRPDNDESTHHGIRLDRIKDWKDRWEILGL